jgi:hypothetical protein
MTTIAILGGGPSALYMFKRLLESKEQQFAITIFEKGTTIGSGMPYSHQGAADEHVTNVSGNEIPPLVTDVADWIKSVPKDTLDKYQIDPQRFNDYKVLPRLLFGQYLCDQFGMLLMAAKDKNLPVEVNYNTMVTDITDQPDKSSVKVSTNKGEYFFDRVIVCTGHLWPKRNEGEVKGWFDSPYPPEKIALQANHPVAVRGASLTAIDAVRTLARHNGEFFKNNNGKLAYRLNPDSPDFRLVLHSRNGLLPAVRFHLEDTHLGKDTVLDSQTIRGQREANDGFLPLDFVFEENFKKGICENDPHYYQEIKDLQMEDFVDSIMNGREQQDPFDLLKYEYAEAERSIKDEKSVYWKEQLAILSFAMNYPAKYFSAEDRLRLEKTLMPLISVVIAFVPQSSAETLMALHDAGILSMKIVKDDENPEPATDSGASYAGQHYPTFVDAVGQPHLTFEDIPFSGLHEMHTISPARLRFQNPDKGKEHVEKNNKRVRTIGNDFYLTVPGIAINDHFQPLDSYNALNERIYIMAVPFIGGYNPDYSGLDFGEAASELIVKALIGSL